MKSELQCTAVAEHVSAHVPFSIDVAIYDTKSIVLLLQQILCKKLQAQNLVITGCYYRFLLKEGTYMSIR
jgi:hypothetical protein